MPTPLLLIDDDDLSREVLTLLLEEDGFAVEAFASGDEALAGIAQNSGAHYSVALSDMQMPGMSGPGLARALRDALGPEVWVIAMSGSARHASELEGFNGFLLKPFAPRELRALIGALSQKDERLESADPAGAASSSPVLDTGAFEELSALMRPAQMKELLALCFAEIGRYEQSMQKAVERKDLAGVRAAAHSLKGSVAMIGARELQSLASRLEFSRDGAAYQAATLAEISPATERLRRMLLSRGVELALERSGGAHEDTIA